MTESESQEMDGDKVAIFVSPYKMKKGYKFHWKGKTAEKCGKQ